MCQITKNLVNFRLSSVLPEIWQIITNVANFKLCTKLPEISGYLVYYQECGKFQVMYQITSDVANHL